MAMNGQSPHDTMRAFLDRKAAEERAAGTRQASASHAALPGLVALLVGRHGARRVWLFGSLAWGQAGVGSDIDLGVEGLPSDRYFRALGDLLAVAPCRVDLVRIEDAPESLATRIRAEGEVLHDG